MTRNLELRVLSGIHDGARCVVLDGALIGSHAGCDVVLCDDGIAEEAARLSIGTAAWGIHIQDPAGQATQEVRFGTPLPLGPVLLTVADAAAPWPTPEQILAAQESDGAPRDRQSGNAAPEDEADDPRVDTAAAPDDRGPAAKYRSDRPTDDGEAAAHAPMARRRKGLELRWAVGGLLILLVFGSVASFPPAKDVSSPRVQAGLGTDTETLVRAQRLLAERGYAPRVHATLSSQQEVVVSGWVQDELEHDRLATDLSIIWPLPAMRVAKQTEVEARMRSRMQGLDVHVAISSSDEGNLAIRGIAGSDEAREQAYRLWQEDASTAAPPAMTLLLAADLKHALDEAVAAAALPSVTSSWKDQRLRVDPGALDSSQRQQLQALLDTLNAIYMDALRMDGDTPAPTSSMPFRIQTAVGGRQPWVVLDDGTRIVVGGTHGAYRLTSVEDANVIFDGPTTVVIPR